ncbi:MAG: efflux transporter periplasmic adaptor subunit, partial [Betaproteobacteria bacterium RIFCSPLOWO2_12_FULL_62_13]
LAEAGSRAQLAGASARRYAELRAQGFVSQEATDAKAHEANAAKAAADAAAAQLAVSRRDRERALADVAGVGKLRAQARLLSPVDGVVSARLVEPGTTIVAGQAVLQIIDPASLWVKARIDQGQAGAARVGQPAEIVLRSDPKRVNRGQVERVDWLSDAVTEERIVNIGFAARPERISVGELVEVTIRTAELANVRWVPVAAVKRLERQDGVWQFSAGRVAFRPVKLGITTLDGRSQIIEGLEAGDEVVVHSEQALKPDARVKVVTAIVRAGS